MPPKKTPSTAERPAAKTTKRAKKAEGAAEKRHRKRVETFSIYIYKVLR